MGKYIVINESEINTFLSTGEARTFNRCLDSFDHRKKVAKKESEYIVIDKKEPIAETIEKVISGELIAKSIDEGSIVYIGGQVAPTLHKFTCCGEVIDIKSIDLDSYNFCPHCGAIIKKGE